MKFTNVVFRTTERKIIGTEPSRIKPQPIKTGVISMDAECQCGHRWNVQGRKLSLGGTVECPSCKATDNYIRLLD